MRALSTLPCAMRLGQAAPARYRDEAAAAAATCRDSQ
jgi:hypothetical protein